MAYSLNSIIYNSFIDPLLSGAQRRIIGAISPGEKVLDVACGTGSLSLRMAGIAGSVHGIDLDKGMIGMASERARRREIGNAIFSLHDASDLHSFADNSYDTAVSSMAIHQFDSSLAVKILREMNRVAARIIIMDYNFPLNKGLKGRAVRLIEAIAGGDHYRNFKIYNELGGLDHFLHEASITLYSELYSSQVFRIIECKSEHA